MHSSMMLAALDKFNEIFILFALSPPPRKSVFSPLSARQEIIFLNDINEQRGVPESECEFVAFDINHSLNLLFFETTARVREKIFRRICFSSEVIGN
jgi:hypothetical protein